MKQTYRYDRGTARLEIEGLADSSLNQPQDFIGILIIWRVKIIGGPILEGKKDHLEDFMSAVLQYSRYRLSGLKRSFGISSSFVSISPTQDGHSLELRSGQEGVEPLRLNLDDAELSDLTCCFDLLRNDKRVNIHWSIPSEEGLGFLEFVSPSDIAKNFVTPFLGALSILGVSLALLLLPTSVEEPFLLDKDNSTTLPES